MNTIDVGKNGYEALVYAYMSDRLLEFPVKSCREWLKECTNALEWCGSLEGFNIFVSGFEQRYIACVLKVRPLILKEVAKVAFC